MNIENPKNTLPEKILQKIQSGKITMKPRWHFILRGTLLALGSILLALGLLYLISLIFFSLWENGLWFGPGFGMRGVRELLISLPWLLIFFAGIFIVILEILVKHYSFSYRKPLLFSAFSLLILAVLGGFFVALTPMHKNLYMQARRQNLPFGKNLYFSSGRPKHLETGQITEIISPNFRINTVRDENILVSVQPQTHFFSGALQDLQVGDSVVIFGQRTDHTINAQDIREVTGQIPFLPPMPMMQP